MYDVYDIINLFGDKYWTYECPEGGTPSLICANKLQQYTMYKIVITHYAGDNKESTLQVPYPTEIEFKVEGINNEYIFLKTGQFQEIPDDTFTQLKPVEKLQYDNMVNLYCNQIISSSTIVQDVEIDSNRDGTGVIIYFTCYCMDPYEPVTHSIILPCSCDDVAVAVFDGDEILCGEAQLLGEEETRK